MIDPWWWRASCVINGLTFGRQDEPLCSRAWRHGWQRFCCVMQIVFRDPIHCEDVYRRWRSEI